MHQNITGLPPHTSSSTPDTREKWRGKKGAKTSDELRCTKKKSEKKSSSLVGKFFGSGVPVNHRSFVVR